MSETKLKRLIVSVTVGAVMLVVILLLIMTYQLISIGVTKNRIEQLEKKIAEYEVLIESGEDTIEARSMREWIEREARLLGYEYGNS